MQSDSFSKARVWRATDGDSGHVPLRPIVRRFRDVLTRELGLKNPMTWEGLVRLGTSQGSPTATLRPESLEDGVWLLAGVRARAVYGKVRKSLTPYVEFGQLVAELTIGEVAQLGHHSRRQRDALESVEQDFINQAWWKDTSDFDKGLLVVDHLVNRLIG